MSKVLQVSLVALSCFYMPSVLSHVGQKASQQTPTSSKGAKVVKLGTAVVGASAVMVLGYIYRVQIFKKAGDTFNADWLKNISYRLEENQLRSEKDSTGSDGEDNGVGDLPE